MNKTLEDIYQFSCPRWEELPDNVFSSQIVEYFNQHFHLIITQKEKLTQDMIRNYVKWKMIEAPQGRKYSKEQVAFIIVICIFKQVISIKDIVEGARLQNKLMDYSEAYNLFADQLEHSIQSVFGSAVKKSKNKIIFNQLIVMDDTIGLSTMTIAFAYRLLSEYIIQRKGFNNIIKK
ncbi:DUF1836 domain-containing protein [Facklamia miroungae]|uniref:DUF1836 domain-containing protein n=1 Tax=Facklamia miroungae TaxID=120956 RepID=A0A1G7PVM3_9LACT|nr:DUF1836 domain-containing protein [Facklamia miroungae]NKZ28845.1 DUF1836 domain-containing protein [Facklamia miroungae]SDF90275.1 protein of unknown function [Facklamia miroungae]